MEKNKTTHIAFLTALLALCSCAQEAEEESGLLADGKRIFFRSSLPGVDLTRAGVITDDDLTECRVACFIPNDNDYINPTTGKMTPYFEDTRFVKDSDGNLNKEDGDFYMWPESNNRLHFFAFWPYAETINNSTASGGTPLVDYRLKGFKVNNEISNHIDFVAAYTSGTQADHGMTGIELDFKHQLARVELSAWSESTLYSVEIAGLRIGNAVTEGDFRISSLMNKEQATWIDTKRSVVEHIFDAGETIVTLAGSGYSHSDKENAASIMGAGIPAMVIPMAERIEAWEGLDDLNIGAPKYTTGRLYFSVLLRATGRGGETVYPYADDPYGLPVVYLVVGPDGKIVRRVYMFDGQYYTIDVKNESYRYMPLGNERILGFCWASIPVAAKWEAGKIYAYKLNYSDGLGWHDPSIPQPGTPILTGKVAVSVDVADWKEGTKTETTVPRK